jgi:hypothetical protein
MSTTAIGYIRVSTDGQAREGVSLDAQRERIEAYAKAKGLELVDVLVDEGLSGKTIDRPALQLLLKRCRTGAVGHVIIWKLDRLTRRTRHLLRLVEDVFLARRIELHSVSESLDTSPWHTSGPTASRPVTHPSGSARRAAGTIWSRFLKNWQWYAGSWRSGGQARATERSRPGSTRMGRQRSAVAAGTRTP